MWSDSAWCLKSHVWDVQCAHESTHTNTHTRYFKASRFIFYLLFYLFNAILFYLIAYLINDGCSSFSPSKPNRTSALQSERAKIHSCIQGKATLMWAGVKIQPTVRRELMEMGPAEAGCEWAGCWVPVTLPKQQHTQLWYHARTTDPAEKPHSENEMVPLEEMSFH